MKKFILLLLFFYLFYIAGCSSPAVPDTANSLPFTSTDSGQTSAAQNNPYFYKDEQTNLFARAQYYDLKTLAEGEISLHIDKIKSYKNGSLYKLTVAPVGYLTEERLYIYFYVTTDKIYRIYSYSFYEGALLTFYNNDKLLTETFDTDEKIIANSDIVCQTEDMSLTPAEGESGSYISIQKMEDTIAYSRRDIQENGESGFYESFVWKEGAGLIEYKSGYKMESDILYLYDISTDTKEQCKELSGF